MSNKNEVFEYLIDQHLIYLGTVRRPDAPGGIRNVLLDGGVPVSGTRRRERALPVSG